MVYIELKCWSNMHGFVVPLSYWGSSQRMLVVGVVCMLGWLSVGGASVVTPSAP